jgi:cell division septum initiation protein DivIVA
MAGEKHFGNSLFGFNKQNVNSYIENLIKEFENKIKGYEAEIDRLANENRELREKYEKLAAEEERIYQEKERIAEALLHAQEKAQLIIEEAMVKAKEEHTRSTTS